MFKIRLLHQAYTLSSLFIAFSFVWLTLYHVNFFYSTWHDHGGIKETIEYFAPKNSHIKGFDKTTKAERNKVFAKINHAVHLQPKLLQTMTFSLPSGEKKALLHEREIIHLNDVANMIKALYWLILLMFILWLMSVRFYIKKRLLPPTIKYQSLSLILLLVFLSLLTFIIGATEVFYWLHEVIFPDGHQWFFYYEDSLMSTLMSAPDLFGWIALSWLILLPLYFSCWQSFIGKVISHNTNKHTRAS